MSRKLFEDTVTGPGLVVDIHRSFLAVPEADVLNDELLTTISWSQDEIVMFGRHSPVPRLSAWLGEPGLTYSYSGIDLVPDPMIPSVRQLAERLERTANAPFNSVLVNRYRSGADGVAWHADDEPELGAEPTIASVSLGATRRFQFRRKDDPAVRVELALHHGDLIIMSGSTQALWHHQIPKTRQTVGERINLTFRRVLESPEAG